MGLVSTIQKADSLLNAAVINLLQVNRCDHTYEYNEFLQILQGLAVTVSSLLVNSEVYPGLNEVSALCYFEILIVYLEEIERESSRWIRGMGNEDYDNLIILLSKLETLAEMFDSSLTSPKDDLFWIPQDSPRWQRLKTRCDIETIGDSERVSSSFNDFVLKVAVGQAFMASGMHEEKGIMQKLSIGVMLIVYNIFKKKALRRTRVFYAKPRLDITRRVWELAESKLGIQFFHISLPKIAYNKVIFIPRIAPSLLQNSIYETSNSGLIHYTALMNESLMHTGTKYSLTWDPKKVRVPIRILAPSQVVSIAKEEKNKSHISCCDSEASLYSFPSIQFDKLILHIHGGGFIASSSSSHQNYTRKWVNGLHIPVFSVDYRLAPEHPYPCAIEDVWEAYYWIVKYAKKHLGIHPSKIVIIGDSAGGNLAVALAYKCILSNIQPPSGVILCYPALNLDKCNFTPSMLLSLEDLLIPHTFLKMCADSYVPDPEMDRSSDPYISPLKASPSLLARMPPTRIFVGTQDPFHDDCWRYLEKLVNAGVDARMKVYEGVLHGPLNFDIKGGVPECAVVTQQCMDWVKEFMI
jgi:hormone-sensitive lipase